MTSAVTSAVASAVTSAVASELQDYWITGRITDPSRRDNRSGNAIVDPRARSLNDAVIEPHLLVETFPIFRRHAPHSDVRFASAGDELYTHLHRCAHVRVPNSETRFILSTRSRVGPNSSARKKDINVKLLIFSIVGRCPLTLAAERVVMKAARLELPNRYKSFEYVFFQGAKVQLQMRSQSLALIL